MVLPVLFHLKKNGPIQKTKIEIWNSPENKELILKETATTEFEIDKFKVKSDGKILVWDQKGNFAII